MEGKPRDNEYDPIDRLARDGKMKDGDIPGADLYDQEGDLTNVTEGGENERDVTKDRVHRQKEIPAEYAGGGMHIMEENTGNEEDDDDDDDAAARWLKEHDNEGDKAA